jgi:phosphorylcholine metabolism protein LicD
MCLCACLNVLYYPLLSRFSTCEFCRAKRFFSLTRMRVHKCYIAIKFANRLLRRKKELEWLLQVRTFSRRKKSLAKQISKFPFCCRSAYIRRIQNLFLYFVRRFWRRLSSSNLSKLVSEQQESPAVQCRHFFCISRTLAIFDCGKQILASGIKKI